MSNRFHNKFHRQNHHSDPTPGYPDSAMDPIASFEQPFKGEFYSQGDIITTENLSAKKYVYADDGLFHKDLTVKGNFTVLGTTSQIDTLVYTTSAVNITNAGTGPALTVTQTGSNPIAHFIDSNGDDIVFADNGYVGLGVASPSEKLTISGNLSSSGTATIGTIATGATNSVITQSAGLLQKRDINPQVWDTTAKFISASDGALTVNRLTKAENSNGIDESIVYDDGTNVGIGTDTPGAKLTIAGNLSSSGTATIGTIATGATNSVVIQSAGLLQKRDVNPQIWDTTAKYVSASDGALSVNYLTKATNSNGINESIISDNGSLVYVGGNVTISGNLTALGNSYFANTLFTTTSSISVINYGPGPAIYAYQSSGNQDIASFYDGDGVEVLHVGNCPPGELYGKVGINESDPNKELTVKGSVSASGTLNVGTINTNAASDSIVVLGTNNILEKRTIDSRAWGSSLVDGTGTTNYVTKWSDSNTVTNSIVFDNGTNVGIGTTTPGAKLTVSGTLSTSSTVNVGGIGTGTDNSVVILDTNGFLRTDEINPQVWDTTSKFVSASDGVLTVNRLTKAENSNGIDESIVFDDGTNVGIGTDTPAEKLTIAGNLSSSGTATIGTLATGTGSSFVIESNGLLQKRSLNTGALNTTATFVSASDGALTVNRLTKAENSNGIDESIVYDDGTNVGIGTDTPVAKLTVSGTLSTSSTVNVAGIGAGVDNSVVILDASGFLRTDEIDSRVWGSSLVDGTGTTNYITKWSDADTITNSIVFDNGTNVGIGTTTPAEKLTIVGNLSSSGTATIGTIAAGATNSVLIQSSGLIQKRDINPQVWDTIAKYVSASDADLTVNRLTKATNSNGINESIVFDNGTNVGIGTDTPGAKLTVSGTLSTSGTATIGTLATNSAGTSFVVETAGLLQKRSLNVGSLDTTAVFVSASDGALTVNRLTKATNSNGINESIVTDDGTIVSIAGNLSSSGTATIGTLATGTGSSFVIESNGLLQKRSLNTAAYDSTYTTVYTNSATWNSVTEKMPLYTNIDTARFGDFSYLEPDVKASFDGPQVVSGQTPFFIVEKDGSVSGLRAGSNNGNTIKQYFVRASDILLTDLRSTDTEYRPSCLAANEYIGRIFDGNEHGIFAEVVNSLNTTQRKLYWIILNGTLNPSYHSTYYDVTSLYSTYVTSTPMSALGYNAPNGSLVYCPEKDLFITVSNPAGGGTSIKSVNYKLINRTTGLLLSSYTITVGASGLNLDHSSSGVTVLLKSPNTISIINANTGNSQRSQIRYHLEGSDIYISNLLMLMLWDNVGYYSVKYNSVFTYNFAISAFADYYAAPHIHDNTISTRVAPFFAYPDYADSTPDWNSLGSANFNIIRSPNDSNVVFSSNKFWSAENKSFDTRSYNIATTWKDVILNPFSTSTSPLTPNSSYIRVIPKDASLLGKDISYPRFITNNKIATICYSNLNEESTGSSKTVISTINDIANTRMLLGLSALDIPSSVVLTNHPALTVDGGFVSVIDSTNAATLSTEYFDTINRRFVTANFNVDPVITTNQIQFPSNWLAQINTLLSADNPVYSLSGYQDWDFFLYNMNNIDYLCSYSYRTTDFFETGFCLLSTNGVTFSVLNNQYQFLNHWNPPQTITSIQGQKDSYQGLKTAGLYKTTESGKNIAYVIFNTPLVSYSGGGYVGNYAAKIDLTDNQILSASRIAPDAFQSQAGFLGVHPYFGPYQSVTYFNNFSSIRSYYNDNTNIIDTNTRVLSSFTYILGNGGIGTRDQTNPFSLPGGSRLNSSLYTLTIESATGFIVYSSETPVFLNGSYYMLPTQTWDLNNDSYWLETKPTSITNKTIRAYATIQNNEAVLAFSTSVIPDDASTLFIGNIGTTTIGVSSSDLNKLTRLGKGLYITNDTNNVGIGTTTPGTGVKLDVNGVIRSSSNIVTPAATTALPSSNDVILNNQTTSVTITAFSGGVAGVTYTITNKSTHAVTLDTSASLFVRGGNSWASQKCTTSAEGYIVLPQNFSCSLRMDSATTGSSW